MIARIMLDLTEIDEKQIKNIKEELDKHKSLSIYIDNKVDDPKPCKD